MQIGNKTSHLFDSYADMQLILCKDNTFWVCVKKKKE